MAQAEKARVFMSGRSQAVRLPVKYRFEEEEVYIRRDPRNGDVVLSRRPADWGDIFEALDRAGFPEDFLADRAQGVAQEREEL